MPDDLISPEVLGHDALTPALPQAEGPRAAWRLEWGLIAALWQRDMLHLLRERSRWLGVVVQPLIFWLILGGGMAGSFTLPGAEGVSYLQFLYPGIVLMIVLFVMLFATIGVIEDRQSGFLQAVLVAPGSRASMVLGKVFGITSLALIQAGIFLALAPLAGISLTAAHWPLLLGSLLLTCLGLGGVTFAMAWVSPSAQAYHAIMGVLLLPLWVLSGAMFPGGKGWIQAVMLANPLTYAVDGLRLSLGVPGAHGDLLVALGALGGFATIGLGLAFWVTRRRKPAGGQR
jgi:ABC-2 type transport system permease protein